ncbi:phytoene/squalene synthase family protein, partial [Lysobacter xanthus]
MDAVTDGPSDAFPAGDPAAFVAKWQGAWPEWPLARGFVPAATHARAQAWEALQFEWQEAAWGGGDARPGEAKLVWWADELAGWAQGRRRHPLGSVLQREPAPWRDVASSLAALVATRGAPSDAASAREALAPVAAAIADAECALLGGATDARAVTAGWLHARLARHPDAAVPTSLGSGATGRAAWARELGASWPTREGAPPARGVMLALAGARLARGDAAAPLPPWRAVFAGW